MNSSMFPSGELPPRKCETFDPTNGTMSSGHVAATECYERNLRDGFHGNQMNCSARNLRDGFHGNQMNCSSRSFHDMPPNMHNIHTEATLYGAGHVHRAPVLLTCSCSGQQPELFHDHDNHQRASQKRCCHGITVSSNTNSNQTGHLHNVCDRGCCGSVAVRRERSVFANCRVERPRSTSCNSLFVDSLEFQRSAMAVERMSRFPSMPTEVETRRSSLHTGSMANSAFPMRTKGVNNQIMLYGWFLMKPLRENYNADSSTFSTVAIGGYRYPRMEEKDFLGTANVVQRLERWKLRTSDGLEVGLMGMINIERSVANGFSPSLVQCFTIGFPSAWVYMLLNLQKGVSKGFSPGILSRSASPTNSAGPAGVIGNPMKDCRGISITFLPEKNPVQSCILQSSSFPAAPAVETKMAILRRSWTATATPSHDRVSSDANSIPQLHLGYEQVGAPKDGDHSCLEAGFVKVSLQPEDPSSCRGCSLPIPEEDVLVRDSGDDPETSSQAQIPSKFKDCSSDTDDFKVEDGMYYSPGPSLIAIENIADDVQFEVSNRGAETCDGENGAAKLGSMAPDDVPWTPLLQTRERSGSNTETPAADASSIEPVVDRESPVQHVEVSKLNSEIPITVVNTPITVSGADPVSQVQTRDRRKRMRSVSDSPLPDFAVTDPSDTAKIWDKRKRQRRELHSPVADIPSVESITVTVPDLVGTVKTWDRRKRRRESHSPIPDVPGSEPITGSVPNPVVTVKTRDRSRCPRSESYLPVVYTPSMEPVVGSACSFRHSDCQVEKGDAQLDDELIKGDTRQRHSLDVEVNQSCKDINEVRGHARRKRYKISRNYYQRGKKKSRSKRVYYNGPSRSTRSTATLESPLEETNAVIDDALVVEDMTEAVRKEVRRSPMSNKRIIPKLASSLEVLESSPQNNHIKRSRQAKKYIVPPPLPPPRVADKSKVTEAFGLKRSLHGRVLVPPLATWRSQSIKYDTDGGIIAISDGFTGSDDESCTGYYNFKPPPDKGARTMQRRLCKAADKGFRRT